MIGEKAPGQLSSETSVLTIALISQYFNYVVLIAMW